MSVPFSPLITQPKTPDFMKKLQSILWMAAAGFLATACETPTQYEYVRLIQFLVHVVHGERQIQISI